MILGLMVAIMYFLVILPQRKDQQKYKAMIAGLKKNDEVITSGGIWGKILRIHDDKLVIKTDDQSNSRVTIHRAYVREVIRGTDESKSD